MDCRSQRGATLGLIVACIIIAIALAVAFYCLLGIFGGVKELQNAVDSGNLNVARRAIRNPSVALKPGVERSNFSGLVDLVDINNNGEINLLTHGRVLGQILIVCINAQDEGTALARDNAQKLIEAFQNGPGSLSGRLATRLSTASNLSNHFESFATANSVRLLGRSNSVMSNNNQFQIAFMEANGPTNIYLDPSILPLPPPANIFASERAPARRGGFNYVAGYRQLTIPTIGNSFGATVRPLQQPNLVSLRNFNLARLSPAVVPPNAFRSAGFAGERCSGTTVEALSCSIVGALDNDFPMSVPRGYLKIVNPRGYDGPAELPSVDNIFNNELMTGIYLGLDEGGSVAAFSLDAGAINDFINYNNNPIGPPPALFNSDGSTRVYLPNGDTPSSATQLSTVRQPGIQCNTANTGGPGAVDPCNQAGVINGFCRAFPHDGQPAPGHPDQLAAADKCKEGAFDIYEHDAWYRWQACNLAGMSVQEANIQAPMPDMSTVFPYFSGMQLVDYSVPHIVHRQGPIKFSTAGTVLQYLNQIGHDAPDLINRLTLRIRQIRPETTLEQVRQLLSTRNLNLDSVNYIYMQDQVSRRLVFTPTPPPWLVSGTRPDGKPIKICSQNHPTIPNICNVPGDLETHDALFYVNPDPETTCVITDQVIWTESTGFNNLLGSLEFRSFANGPGTFAQPN